MKIFEIVEIMKNNSMLNGLCDCNLLKNVIENVIKIDFKMITKYCFTSQVCLLTQLFGREPIENTGNNVTGSHEALCI